MSNLFKQIVLGIIKVYQKIISPDHGFFSFLFPYGICRFTPTCSEYCYEAIEKYGILKGFLIGTRRIIRCRPGQECGHDPVK